MTQPMTDPSLFTPADLVTGLIAMNFFAFAAFGIDKLLAEAGRRRIRESTLLTLALLGGTPGAYAGRAAFRHKTHKQPFSSRLHAIGALHLLALAAAIAWLLAG
jgi:uncharacterized membrane protein YsdA (DUF1294 family)